MIGQVMREARNFFDRGYRVGAFSVRGGQMTPAPESPYVAISGSKADGVYRVDGGRLVGADGWTEDFRGRVWYLYPPADFVALCGMIEDYQQKHADPAIISESFGAYSYTSATDESGAALGWQAAFKNALNGYRRMFTEVDV